MSTRIFPDLEEYTFEGLMTLLNLVKDEIERRREEEYSHDEEPTK